MTRCLYLHGFASGPGSHKAAWFAARLEKYGLHLEVPDLNAGDFQHLTLTRQMRVIESLLAGQDAPVALIGSSFGGYLAALLAERDSRIERLVLLAPALGFGGLLERLFGRERMQAWRREGCMRLPAEADSAERWLDYGLVDDLAIHDAVTFHRQLPALVCHGIDDPTVPYAGSVDYLRQNRSARLLLLADGHSLDASLEVIWEQLRVYLGLDA